MCRNIRPLYNYDPPSTREDIHLAALQFVRKISGYNKPSKINTKVFDDAVKETELMIEKLLDNLQTTAKPRNRISELEKLKELNKKRFGTS